MPRALTLEKRYATRMKRQEKSSDGSGLVWRGGEVEGVTEWVRDTQRVREQEQETASQSTCWIIWALKHLITVSGYARTDATACTHISP